jgi:hypothetical protein
MAACYDFRMCQLSSKEDADNILVKYEKEN